MKKSINNATDSFLFQPIVPSTELKWTYWESSFSCILTWSSLFRMMMPNIPHFLFVFHTFRYRDGFDTILINDASKISELDTLPALEFSPSSIILFGDEKRWPEDRYGLFNNLEKHSKKSISLKKTYYQTIFHRFRSFGH